MAKGKKTGGGSRLGRPNKFTVSAREAFEMAFGRIGGMETLAKWAEKNPTEFFKLYARLIPVASVVQTKAYDPSEFERRFRHFFGREPQAHEAVSVAVGVGHEPSEDSE